MYRRILIEGRERKYIYERKLYILKGIIYFPLGIMWFLFKPQGNVPPAAKVDEREYISWNKTLF